MYLRRVKSNTESHPRKNVKLLYEEEQKDYKRICCTEQGCDGYVSEKECLTKKKN